MIKCISIRIYECYRMSMPRKARIDAPGALHHIICRGIEQRRIFGNDADRENLLERLGNILEETATPCYAWTLIPNHFHLLLRTGKVPISTIMRRLLTGYAVSYNHRHRRCGHLFQNRFKSILCQEDLYLKELVGYIHLNPLRAEIVDRFEELANHPYCGHGALLGNLEKNFLDVEFVLKQLGDSVSAARKNYEEFIRKRIALGSRPELVGGGLLRSSGGWAAIKALSKARAHLKGDERILGESDFVEEVLAEQKEQFEQRYWLEAEGYDIERVVARVATLLMIEPAEIWKPGNQPLRVKARSLTCYWAVRKLGMSGTSVGKLLGVGQPADRRTAS